MEKMDGHLVKFKSERMREVVQIILLAGSIVAGFIALLALILS